MNDLNPTPAPAARPNLQKEYSDRMPIPFVTRKSPAILILQLLVVFFGLNLFYVLLRAFDIPGFGIDFASLGVFGILLLAQGALIGIVVVRWLTETYEVHDDDLHHNWGFFLRHEEAYPYNNIQTITCAQSLLGRVLHYGSVHIFVPTLGKNLEFDQVPHPHHFIHTIRLIMPYPDQGRYIMQGDGGDGNASS